MLHQQELQYMRLETVRSSIGETKGGYGKTIVMKHGTTVTTLYAHLSRYGKFKNWPTS